MIVNQASEAVAVLGDGFYRVGTLLRLVDDLPPSVRGELIVLARRRFAEVAGQVDNVSAMLDRLDP